MQNANFKGTADITHAGIKKHFTRHKDDPFQAVIELVANGFDAAATNVEISIQFNAMDGLESISVLDNGFGIDVDNCDQHFSRFNESLKQDNDDLQGTHGRGRLSFHLLAERATWFTRCKGADAQIVIESSDIRNFKGIRLDPKEQHAALHQKQSGTCVELSNFTKNLPLISKLEARLQNTFGWRLALNRKRKLLLNGVEITVPNNEFEHKAFTIDNHEFIVTFIRCHSKPGKERSLNYLIDNEGKVIFSELSSFNLKPKFYLSTYTESKWNQYFDRFNDSLNFEHDIVANPSTKVFKTLQREITKVGQQIYDDFQRQLVDIEIERFVKNGYFPSYKGLSEIDANWQRENTKRVIRDIYLAEPSIFTNLKAKQTKVIIALLDKLLISNENDSLFEVLENILDLADDKMERLAAQINRTSLENIICTIETLQKRELAVHKLQEIMVRHYKTVLETPDLQGIIENNTWLFGEQYTTLGAEEDDFQKIAKKLREHIKGINLINEEDFDEEDIRAGLDIEGVRRQVDLFLARKNMAFDARNRQYFKCTIIEIKKPSVSLNEKHLKQLRDYARIIAQHVGFSEESMKFELILIGRKISSADYDINAALETAEHKNEPGLVHIQGHGRIKGYVKTWATIFDEFKLSNHYLLNNLKTKRDNLEGKTASEIVVELQHPVH
jgi:hypothetical protein